MLGKLSGRHAVGERVKKLGFNLKEKELDAAFARFKALADKKKYIFDEDIEAILEEGFAHIPEAWKLDYLKINIETGRIPNAALRLSYKGSAHEAASEGDGPIDACYKAIDLITGLHPTLKDYQLRAVTSGKDAQGEVTARIW